LKKWVPSTCKIIDSKMLRHERTEGQKGPLRIEGGKSDILGRKCPDCPSLATTHGI